MEQYLSYKFYMNSGYPYSRYKDYSLQESWPNQMIKTSSLAKGQLTWLGYE